MGIARSSLDEVQEHLRYCQLAGLITEGDAQRLMAMAGEGAATCSGLMRYLMSSTARENAGLKPPKRSPQS